MKCNNNSQLGWLLSVIISVHHWHPHLKLQSVVVDSGAVTQVVCYELAMGLFPKPVSPYVMQVMRLVFKISNLSTGSGNSRWCAAFDHSLTM